jgi:hypothetical protein
MESGIVPGVFGGLDVPVAGFGAGGLNTQHHHIVTGGSLGNALLQRLQEAWLVADHMV